MTEKKVKGSLLAIQARFIRANKDKDWDKYLKPEDWEIISGRVLPSLWYPLETFQRCGVAVFELMAGGNLEVIRSMGKVSVEQLATGVYKAMATKADPLKAFDQLVMLIGQLFNYGGWRMEKVEQTHIKIHFSFDEKNPATELFSYLMLGAFEQVLEMAGGSNNVLKFAAKEWEGDSETIYDIEWG